MLEIIVKVNLNTVRIGPKQANLNKFWWAIFSNNSSPNDALVPKHSVGGLFLHFNLSSKVNYNLVSDLAKIIN